MVLEVRASNHGQGHIKRCQALVEAWGDNPGEWVVLDDYEATLDDHKRIRAEGHKLLVIDDNAHLPRYSCDVLLNYNLYAKQLKYKVDKDTRLLLGPEYALIRREFTDFSHKRTIPAVAHHILVALGSAATDELRQAIRIGLGQIECEVRWAEGDADMPSLMSWADLYLGAAGVTTYEAAYMGLPMALVVTADNQVRNADAWNQARLSWNLGQAETLGPREIAHVVSIAQHDREGRELMSRLGSNLVDGKGAERVVKAILNE